MIMHHFLRFASRTRFVLVLDFVWTFRFAACFCDEAIDDEACVPSACEFATVGRDRITLRVGREVAIGAGGRGEGHVGASVGSIFQAASSRLDPNRTRQLTAKLA
jgi:hypothetical protein